MIYKIYSKGGDFIEFQVFNKKEILFTTTSPEGNASNIYLDSNNLHDMIGALHVIKNKLDKEGKDAK